ncbi:hypothetical protein [Microvirga tunisiensis]|uniref:Uncharacterized protein n=1 Tax=Microvirga tunisiensis TaxID=2108360 RepID=A0A5N7MNG2_9HYPH|nr:hypothetical protein [Microvirga tunisiensis]MPR11131.1 hypothetical protein [Microvirga tunisiensis]MPR28525.1 hypothetical protein [Microvirga tunisiensis]
MTTLLGFQLADAAGVNIQGDDTDPLDLRSFEVMSPAYAVDAIAELAGGQRYLLMPVFEGDVEEPTVLPSKTAIIPENGNVTAALLQVLRTIKSWPANGNSDPDVMGAALDNMVQLAGDAVRKAEATLAARKAASSPKRIMARFVPHDDFSAFGELTDGAVGIDVTDQILAMPREDALSLKDNTDPMDQLAYDFKNEVGHSGPYHVELEQAIRSYFGIQTKPNQVSEALLLAYRMSLGGSTTEDERRSLDSALLAIFGAPYSSIMAARWPNAIDLGLVANGTAEECASANLPSADGDPEFRDYLVSWSIDMDASSPAVAAELTRNILTDPENCSWHFRVTDKTTGLTHDVHLPESHTAP